MPYDSEGNWITLQERDQNLPAVRMPTLPSLPDDLPDVNQSPEQLQTTRDDALRKAVAVLQFLHNFNKPSNALWGGIYGGVHGADTEGASENLLAGLKEGWNQTGADINLSDVLGVRSPTGDMPWFSRYGLPGDERPGYQPGWLGQAGIKQLIDLVGDPLTYAFMPASGLKLGGKAIKALFPFLKEGQSIGGKALEVSRIPQIAENLSLKSGLNKAFGHEPATETAMAAMDASRRRGNIENQLTKEQVEQAIKAAEEMGVTPEKNLDLFHAIERPQEEVAGIPRDARTLAQPLLERRDQTFELLNEAREATGVEKIPDISGPDYTQMYHRFFGRGPQEKFDDTLGKMREWFTGKPQSRELMRLVKEGTDEVPAGLEGVVTSMEPKYLRRLGIEGTPQKGFVYKEPGTQAPRPTPIDVPPGGYTKPIEEGQYMGLDEMDELLRQTERHPNLPQNRAYGRVPGNKIPVEPTNQVSLKEILEAPNLNIDPFMAETNPFRALEAQMRKQRGELGYREALQEMTRTGDLKRIETAMPVPKGRFTEGELVKTREGQYGVVGNSNKKTTFLDIDGEMHEIPNELLTSLHKTASRLPWETPEPVYSKVWNFLKELPQEPKPRQPKVRGLEEFETHPKTADWLENMASDSDPTARSLAERLLSQINSSRLGEANKNFSNMWKSTVLGLHPGFHTGNLSSNLQLQFQKGMDAADILPRAVQTGRQQLGKGQDLLPGFDLAKEAEIRDVMGGGFFGGQGADIAATEGRGWIHKLGQYPPFKQIGKAQDAGTRFGGHIEDNAREGLFIDYVLKNAPENLATMSPEAQARFFDKAGRFAKTGMIDYSSGGGWTGLEKELLPWGPFYKWSRGVAGTTADTAINRPQKLARLDRFQNQIFEGSDPEDRRAMPDYMREQAPIQGAFGHTFEPNEEGERKLALIARYLPQGNMEQAASRPLDFLASMVGPGPKTIGETVADYSMFKNRNIDDVTGFPGNVVNPIVGGAYADANRQIAGQTLPAWLEYFLGQMPGGRYLNEANELGRATGLWEDKYRKTAPTLGEWLTWWTTGGKEFPFDRERALNQRARELDKEIAAIKYNIRRGEWADDEGRIEKGTRMLEEAQEKNRLLLGQ